MSGNISKILQSGKQPFLNYENVYEVKTRSILTGQSMLSSQQEHSKIGFNYPSYKTFENINQIDKTTIHKQPIELEYKLDLEKYCLVSQFFFFIRYRNNSTDVTKNITHTSPMMNIEKITLQMEGNTVYNIKTEDIYIHNCTRLSHGDKMFTELIDNLGISSSYDIDPTTNNIPPSKASRWYFFAIPLFSYLNIPYNLITNNNSGCILKITLSNNKFILPTSPNTNYSDLVLEECKLLASQIYIHPTSYDNLVKYNTLQFRMNDVQQSFIEQVPTTNLLNNIRQSIKVTARAGGCSLMLVGLREKNNPITFASFIPINNVCIRRKDDSLVKNLRLQTDILRCLNTYEHDTGDFLLKKNLVAISFDSMIDRIILMGYHGGVEVLDDEFYIEFELEDNSVINSAKQYEAVIMMYLPKLLNIFANNSERKIELKA